MIQFLSPGFAWALAAPVLILLLYLMRRRYVPRQIPSTMLWQKALRNDTANRPFQKLKKNLLLPLQLLTAILAALALMRPALPGGTAGRSVLIMDVSGSMQTRSEGRSRLETAAEEAIRYLHTLPAGEEVTVLTAGEDAASVLRASTDREEAEIVLRSLKAERGGADIEKALQLAEAIGREESENGRGVNIRVFSDQYLPPEGVGAVNVGRGEDNRAVISLTAEEDTAYARIANWGDDCTVTVVCSADGRLCEARELEIPSGKTAGVSFRIPAGSRTAEAEIREADALTEDNRAEAAVPVRRQYRAAVAAESSIFLDSALRVRKDITVIQTEKDNPEQTGADLYILGSGPVLFTLHPGTTAFSWQEPEGEETEGAREDAGEKTPEAFTALDTPMTRGLSLKNLAVRRIIPVTGGKPAVFSGEKVIAAYTDTEAVLGFDPHDTNLPLKYDFPILIQNILEMLIPEQITENETETEPPMPAAESDVRYVAPSVQAQASGPDGTNGTARDQSGLAALLFLMLLMAEWGVSRYVG